MTKIALSAGGKWHSYRLAYAAQLAGWLEAFYTTIYFKNPRALQMRALPHRFEGHVLSRHFAPLDRRRVHPIFVPEIYQRLALKLGYPSADVNFVKNEWFDRKVAATLPHVDVFHGWSGFFLHSSAQARRSGALTIVEQGSAHFKHRKEVLEAEYETHGINLKLPESRLTEKQEQEYAACDYIFVPSEYVSSTFEAAGVPKEKLIVNPYGVDPLTFSASYAPDDVFRVIFVGNLSLNKGVVYLLEAFKRSRFKNAELLLIGKPEESFLPLMKAYDGHFRHVSYVPNHELGRYLSRSSVFVLPSLTEGSSLAIYEALSVGLPCIVTEHCGSVIEHGKSGFIVPIRSSDAIAEYLERLYDEPELRFQISLAAQERIREFTWDSYYRRIADTYRRIVPVGNAKP